MSFYIVIKKFHALCAGLLGRKLIFVGSDLSRFKEVYGSDTAQEAAAVLAGANVGFFGCVSKNTQEAASAVKDVNRSSL